MENVIKTFCSRSFENSINRQMLYYDYKFPTEDVLTYLRQIMEIPVEELLYMALHWNEEESIAAGDVFQFSDLDDATYRICTVVKEANNPGVNYLAAGKLLLNDGKMRNSVALIKYGENHLKTAESIGLFYELANVYFLSCIGYATDLLTDNQKGKLLLRLILRNKLIRKLYVASRNGSVSARQFLYMLSDSTYIRRKSNIRSILRILEKSDEFDFSGFVSAILL